MGLLPGDPVYIRPDGTVDRDFLDFVRSTVFPIWNGKRSGITERITGRS
jgi:hypothetical protein